MSRYLYIMSTFSLCLLLVFSNQSSILDKSLFIVSTSLYIIIFSIIQVFSFSAEPYSLHKIFYLFALFFFGIAPLIQYFNHVALWINVPLSDNQYIITNTIVAIILIVYNFLYRVYRGLLVQSGSRNLPDKIRIRSKNIKDKNIGLRHSIFLGISVISFLIVFHSNDFNWVLLFIRGGELYNEIIAVSNNESNSVQWLIINNFVRPMAMLSFMFYYMDLNRLNFFGLILLAIAILTCMPSAMPRFAVAALYLPILIIFFQRFLKKFNFVLAFLVGFLVVFPLLNSFRNFSLDNSGFDFFNFDMFMEGHFDSYQNFALIMSNNIITYGYQFLGALFFWVPRIFWPSKPVGSGTYLAKEMQLDFENISANYFAEGYINFGFIGIILFLIILAAVSAKIDSSFWFGSWKSSHFKSLLYLMTLGFLFFLLRGDLLNSTAYFFGFYFSIVVVHRITSFTNLNRKNGY